jgi:hypothetical protein
MSVALAQAAVYASGDASTLTFTLGSTPTVGNTLVIFGGRSLVQSINLVSWCCWNYQATGLLGAFYHVVQSGDGTSYVINATNGTDGGAILVELSGVGAAPMFTFSGSGAQTWTVGTHTIPSVSIAAPSGSYAIIFVGIATGATSVTAGVDGNAGADTMSNSATHDHSIMSAVSAAARAYLAWGHQSFAGGAGTCSTTVTLGNVTTATNSTSDIMTLVIAATPSPPTWVPGTSGFAIYVADGTAVTTTGAVSLNITNPSDIVIAQVLNIGAGNTITAPSGWSQIGATVTNGTQNNALFWALATVAAGAFTWTTSSAYWISIYEFQGVNRAYPIAASGTSTNTATTIATASVAPTVIGQLPVAWFDTAFAASGFASTWATILDGYNGNGTTIPGNMPTLTTNVASLTAISCTATMGTSQPMSSILTMLAAPAAFVPYQNYQRAAILAQ